jgi:hypothetical protein
MDCVQEISIQEQGQGVTLQFIGAALADNPLFLHLDGEAAKRFMTWFQKNSEDLDKEPSQGIYF